MADDIRDRPPVTLDGLGYQVRDLHRRVGIVEAQLDKYDPAVTDVLIRALSKKVDGVQKALYGLMFVIVTSSITFAFTVFALLGKH